MAESWILPSCIPRGLEQAGSKGARDSKQNEVENIYIYLNKAQEAKLKLEQCRFAVQN